jgi:pyruvate/2-oxoglutarate/acetoin dehydrogenase E1 component/TPP-dependent pyruvate/acetoin dehydrogenase alpha subunit
MNTNELTKEILISKSEILQDYQLACESRQVSLIGRREVFMGRAKFGIFGDGKELAQLAMSKVFKKGDFRSGYYRDQTLAFAAEMMNYTQYFAQLYAHASLEADPSSAGRMMNAHFATRSLDANGQWNNLMEIKNTTADMSPTAAQMVRLVGLGYASKLYRQNPDLHQFTQFSNKGNEIAFGTIGNASTSEGIFFEAINASGVLQIPVLVSVWDDEYGISVPQSYHTTKESISKVLAGFQRQEDEAGWEILTVKAWDYIGLIEAYQRAEKICREEHVPVLIHVVEVTQQQGHSTSGSHERYKDEARLAWEKEFDCNKKFREWIEENGIASSEELDGIEEEARKTINDAKSKAWKAFIDDIKSDYEEALQILQEAITQSPEHAESLTSLHEELQKTIDPMRGDSLRIAKKANRTLREVQTEARQSLQNWIKRIEAQAREDYNSHLYSESEDSPLKVEVIPAEYDENSRVVDGREVLQACFDAMLERDPRVFAIGEDVGKIGDVNQAFAGLQDKHGELRVTDTGIREATIIGQGIGASLRGLRPITEIQYLDYIYYALQILADDVSNLQYRTRGGQKNPLIIRTRGHRLEGIWHSGSPIGTLLHSLRGIHLLVPRNMTQAAGFYNTLLKGDDPALVIECLNGYRLKEKVPTNIGEFTVPLGLPEVIREGNNLSIVTYGSMCRIVMEAAQQLEEMGISCEVIDVQTLLPFDTSYQILKSIQKTNRVVFADEDVPGGATAYMMQQVLEEQNAYQYLDSKPLTITAEAHRPAYGSDGDYFSKPSIETVVDKIYEMMHETNPVKFPSLYK